MCGEAQGGGPGRPGPRMAEVEGGWDRALRAVITFLPPFIAGF